MIDRKIAPYLQKLAEQFKVVALTGPRQSGKTTWLREQFSNYKYYNLESPDVLAMIESDAGGFIRDNSQVILDEVQKMPELLSYIQATTDERDKRGDFILSGSENLLLSGKISQSLAGRAAYATLLPLSIGELLNEGLLKNSLDEQILAGFYPELYRGQIERDGLYAQYITTYLERDVRNIQSVHNLNLFRKFIALLAGRIGQLVNYESLSADVGVDGKTIERWLSVLEASYLIYRLQPYYENFGKRYIRSAKIYFTDVGVACCLLGINSIEELKNHYLRGGLFENLCIIDILKQINNAGTPTKLYFYRDSNGNEVDLVIDNGGQKIPVEIKSSTTFSGDYLKGIKYWRSLSEQNAAETGAVIFAGETVSVAGTKFYNWQEIGKILV